MDVCECAGKGDSEDKFFCSVRRRSGVIRDSTKGPVGPGHEAEGVEPRDVLEDRAAKSQDLAMAVQDPGAQDKVADSAGEGPPGAREPRRHRPAQGLSLIPI